MSEPFYLTVYRHQKKKCFYCKDDCRLEDMEKEHVFPKSKGGVGIANKVLSCRDCNLMKRDLTIDQFVVKIKSYLTGFKPLQKRESERYKNIISTCSNLMYGEMKIRKGWHKKATYVLIHPCRKPIKRII